MKFGMKVLITKGISLKMAAVHFKMVTAEVRSIILNNIDNINNNNIE